MTVPRPNTKCNRCRCTYAQHTGEHKICPDYRATFSHHKRSSRVSQSFSPEEVRWLDQAVNSLLRGGDVSGLARHRSFPRVVARVKAMRRVVESRREQGGGN